MMGAIPYIIIAVILAVVFYGRNYNRRRLRQEVGPNPAPDVDDWLGPFRGAIQATNTVNFRSAAPTAGIVLAGLTLLLFVFWYIDLQWPVWAANYRLHGGPVWSLLAGLFAVGLIYLVTRGRLRTLLIAGVFAFLLFGVVQHATIVFAHGTDTTRGEAAAAVERQQQAEQRALREAAAQVAAEQARAAAAGGAQCLNVTHTGHTFGTAPDDSSVVNPKGKCVFYFVPPPGHCFYMQGYRSTERKGPFGQCANAVPFSKETAPVDMERVWSADQPFVGDYTLKPRSTTVHGVVN